MSFVIQESELRTIVAQLETAQVLTPEQDRGLIQGPIDRLRRLLGTVPTTRPPTPPAPVTPVQVAPAKPWKSAAGLPFLFGLTADNGNKGWDARSKFFGFAVDVVTAFHAQGPGKNTQYRDAGALDRPGKVKLISYALIPAKSDNQKAPADGYTLAGAAAGAYNAEWVALGKKFVERGMNDSNVIARIGWESNGNWYSWSATDGPQWKAAYENAIRSIKTGIASTGQAVKVRFDLCYNLGTSSGSKWVIPAADTWDIISLDAYDFSHPKSSLEFSDKVLSPKNAPGLLDILSLAKANNRLMGIPEFGAQFDDTTAHIDGIIDFVTANQDWIAYVCAFDGGTGDHAFDKAPKNWNRLKERLSALRA